MLLSIQKNPLINLNQPRPYSAQYRSDMLGFSIQPSDKFFIQNQFPGRETENPNMPNRENRFWICPKIIALPTCFFVPIPDLFIGSAIHLLSVGLPEKVC